MGKDRGLPQLTSNRLEITVNIDDVNDNAPYFPADKQTFSVEVREEVTAADVATVNFAIDDDGRNVICYSIIGGCKIKAIISFSSLSLCVIECTCNMY